MWLTSAIFFTIIFIIYFSIKYFSFTQKLPRRDNFKVVIVGSGFGGICAAVKMDALGLPYTIFEKSSRPGGTWNYNIYPGVACDIQSNLYSFSFFPNPNWSQSYSNGNEIYDYLLAVISKYRIREHIEFDSEVVEALFNVESGLWNIKIKKGNSLKHVTANVLISAVGQLNNPKIPDIPGAQDFSGTAFHTARWNSNHSLNNRTVGIIGLGASALQVIPEIQPKVKKLYVFQRSAPYVLKIDKYYFSKTLKFLFQNFPFLLTMERWRCYWTYEIVSYYTVVASKFLRNSIGGPIFLLNLSKEVKDPILRKKLTPNYPIGCKRALISPDNKFYKAMQQENVTLVTDRIKCIVEDGIMCDDGSKYKIDTLIWATGFNTTDFLSPMKIYTTNNSLTQIWKEAPFAYYGITVPKIPNFFILYGPNTNLGSNSIIFMLECQVNYIGNCITEIFQGNFKSIQVKEDVTIQHNKEIQAEMKTTAFGENCTSWYKKPTQNGDEYLVVNNLPYSTLRYWWNTFSVRKSDYIFQ